jgi:integrase
MFKKAVIYGMVERNPFNDGDTLMLKVDNVRERYLAPGEIRKLLDKSPVHLQHIIKCALFTGMRLGNFLSLKWHQIRDGHIYVKTKNGKEAFLSASPLQNCSKK